ncbi:methyltransferase [Vibrio cholerae]|nr:methyltransferase [Vibrio cholerae]
MNRIKNFQGEITRGTRVYTSLYNHGFGVVVALDEACNMGNCRAVGGGIATTGGGYLEIVYENGHRSHYPESLLRGGLQCGVVADQLPASEKEIAQLVEFADKTEREAKEKQNRETNQFNARVEALKTDPTYAHLTQGARGQKEVAINLRAELKKHWPGHKFSVRGDRGGYSSCIRVSWTDGPTKQQVEEILDRYQGGSFNGMTDCYDHESTPFTTVFGSVDYLFFERDKSEELIEQAISKVKEEHPNADSAEVTAANYKKGALYCISPVLGGSSNFSWQRLIAEAANEIDAYTPPAPKKAKASQEESDQNESEAAPQFALKTEEVQTTTHGKTGADLFVVQLSDRIEKEEFKNLCELSKTFGGYYSKFNRDGAIPGFQFFSMNEAQQFRAAIAPRQEQAEQKPMFKASRIEQGWRVVITLGGVEFIYQPIEAQNMPQACAAAWELHTKPTPPTPPSGKGERARPVSADKPKSHGDRLRALADSMTEKAQAELDAPRLENTAKRASQAATMRERARQAIATGETLRALAAAQDAGNAGPLAVISSRAQLENLQHVNSYVIPREYRGAESYDGFRFHRELLKDGVNIADYIDLIQWPAHYADELKKLSISNLEQLKSALTALASLAAKPAQECPIKAAERALIGVKIPGFFPTPEPVQQRLIEEAQIEPHHVVLEPSAGAGDLADAVKATGAAVVCCEFSAELRELLEAKQHQIIAKDCLTVTAGEFDRIVMNPPFEKGQDCDHVRHCFGLLAPGGVLVSVMGTGVTFRTDRKYAEFRQWLEDNGGTIEPLPENSFNTGPRATGVSTVMIKLTKPSTTAKRLH